MGRQWDKKINAEEGIGTEEAFLKELESCASFHGVCVLMWKHFSVVEDNREHFMVEDRKTGKRYQLIYLTPKPLFGDHYRIAFDTTYGNGDYPVRIYVYAADPV